MTKICTIEVLFDEKSSDGQDTRDNLVLKLNAATRAFMAVMNAGPDDAFYETQFKALGPKTKKRLMISSHSNRVYVVTPK